MTIHSRWLSAVQPRMWMLQSLTFAIHFGFGFDVFSYSVCLPPLLPVLIALACCANCVGLSLHLRFALGWHLLVGPNLQLVDLSLCLSPLCSSLRLSRLLFYHTTSVTLNIRWSLFSPPLENTFQWGVLFGEHCLIFTIIGSVANVPVLALHKKKAISSRGLEWKFFFSDWMRSNGLPFDLGWRNFLDER